MKKFLSLCGLEVMERLFRDQRGQLSFQSRLVHAHLSGQLARTDNANAGQGQQLHVRGHDQEVGQALLQAADFLGFLQEIVSEVVELLA